MAISKLKTYQTTKGSAQYPNGFANNSPPALDANFFNGTEDTTTMKGVELPLKQVVDKVNEVVDGVNYGINVAGDDYAMFYIAGVNVKSGKAMVKVSTSDIRMSNGDIIVANGDVVATSFRGSGSNLTNLPANQLLGAIPSTVTAITQAQTVKDKTIATTEYVRQAISDVKNITTATMTTSLSGVLSNTIKRQVNFVIGQLGTTGRVKADNTTIIATIPVGFRPSSPVTTAGRIIISPGIWAGYIFTININGNITMDTLTSELDGNFLDLYFGYEII